MQSAMIAPRKRLPIPIMVKKKLPSIPKNGGKFTTGLRRGNMWSNKLKEAGVNIHVIATGAGAGIQNRLWEIPGSSAYLSGCSFPYAAEEQEELLGFMPEHFCSEEAAVDLASAAYMKAYKFGGKRPVGIGLTASVASEKEHRGDHRIFVGIITDDAVRVVTKVLEKGLGPQARKEDGAEADDMGWCTLLDTLDLKVSNPYFHYEDKTEMARERFFLRPFFAANGMRMATMPDEKKYALYPGAYNPPHEGHFGVAKAAMDDYSYRTVFEVTSDPPHKDTLTVQQLLQRAKLLGGYDRLFTAKLPFYLDKARLYKRKPLILGADAMVRMLDPKWGLDAGDMFNAFYDFGTKLFVAAREVDGQMTTCDNILDDIKTKLPFKVWASARIVMKPLKGEWDISSTELRNKGA
jgi:nicotinamide mononucleotide (NMN) deamidase PncC